MKRFFKLAAAATIASGLSGCSEQEIRLVGAVTGAVIAEATGSSDLGIAGATVAGYALGGVVDKAIAAGCDYTSSPIGVLNFRNVHDGIYLSCPQTRPGNKTIEGLRASPDWQLVGATRSTTYTQPYRTYGNNGNRGPVLRGFN